MSKVVAANWKMNKTAAEAQIWTSQLIESLSEIPADVQVIVAAPFLYIKELNVKFKDEPRVKLAAQNCHFEQKGAFTGEISPSMLRSVGVDYCLLGHSERRTHFCETDELVASKVKACQEVGIIPIVCVGETAQQRQDGYHQEVVAHQVQMAVSTSDLSKPLIFAYEPVWAIGTGINASNDQVADMHAHIRNVLLSLGVLAPTVLYGGSCNDGNASGIFAQQGIDGGLIGSAALNIRSFVRISQSFPA